MTGADPTPRPPDPRLALVAALLHEPDPLGRAIHEENYAAQEPMWNAEECGACPRVAAALLRVLDASDLILTTRDDIGTGPYQREYRRRNPAAAERNRVAVRERARRLRREAQGGD